MQRFLLATLAFGLHAQTFTTLSGFNNGFYPVAPLLQAANGDLYGTASLGGRHLEGTIFKITLGGKLTTVYNFCSQTNCTDGASPSAPLIQSTAHRAPWHHSARDCKLL
jgi:uncharacterized repeat protein (TIGR03803 family)